MRECLDEVALKRKKAEALDGCVTEERSQVSENHQAKRFIAVSGRYVKEDEYMEILKKAGI